MAGLDPSGVLCELVNEDGTMMRMPDLLRFSEEHGIGIVSIASIIAYRREHERIIERVADARLPTKRGKYTITSYRSLVDAAEHVALVVGDISTGDPVLVRVHSECLTGDVFGSLRCDCGEQVDLALQAIESEGRGVFLYMRQEGRGIGIHNKIKAYNLQDLGLDTVDANVHSATLRHRHYGVGAQILNDLGVQRMRILTNNPRKLSGLDGFGLEVVERVPIKAQPTKENSRYLETKRTRLGHLLEESDTHVNGSEVSSPRCGRPPMPIEMQGSLQGEGLRIAVIVARFNDFITSRLLEGATAALSQYGVADENITVVSVPGSFELPFVAKRLATSDRHDAVVCLGAVIRGETDHYEHVAGEAAKGIAAAGMSSGVPGNLRCPHHRHSRAGDQPSRREEWELRLQPPQSRQSRWRISLGRSIRNDCAGWWTLSDLCHRRRTVTVVTI